MTRVVVEELLSGTAVAEPGALERAIRDVCRGTMLRVRVPLRLGTSAALEAQYDVRCGIARGLDVSRLNDVVIVSWEPAARSALPALHAVVTSDLSEDGERPSSVSTAPTTRPDAAPAPGSTPRSASGSPRRPRAISCAASSPS
jgi:hypothetical protein